MKTNEELYFDLDDGADDGFDEFDEQLARLEQRSQRLRERRSAAGAQGVGRSGAAGRPAPGFEDTRRAPKGRATPGFDDYRTESEGRNAPSFDSYSREQGDGIDEALPEGKKPRSMAARITKGIAVSVGLLVLVVVVAVGGILVYFIDRIGDMTATSEATRADRLLSEYQTEFFNTVDAPSAPGESETVVLPEIILPDDLDSVATPDVVNVILVGTDERSTEYREDSRGDSITIASLDTKNGTLKLASIRRETPIPTVARRAHPEADILTSFYRYYREEGVMEFFEEYFGIHIDYYVRVNFVVFEYVVDRMGGVDVELSPREANYMNTQKLVKIDRVKSGKQHLDGPQALIYARIRKIDDNRERVRRQRTVIAQLAAKGSSLSLADLNDILNSVIDAVQTDMPSDVMLKLLTYAPTLLKSDLKSEANYISVPIDKFHLGDYKGNAKALRNLFYGTN